MQRISKFEITHKLNVNPSFTSSETKKNKVFPRENKMINDNVDRLLACKY